ncbi:MAG: tRNA (N6-isopentenyl adenosine(37)-C2)-methylthiotransferase MiaB [Acidobacteriota bacterium]|nr:MAG: tRNA (N6-isopentenyl adenosine(37)-C2)-methylthiotransferase MiaB [Acidobacteriota bacterium]
MDRTFYIETHGCQMNEHDSEKISGLLSHHGMTAVDSVEEADLYILNTCSVREKAAQKVYSRLGELKSRKLEDPEFVIGVVGCVAQQESEQMVKKAPFVDLVVGTHLYHCIPDLIEEIRSRQEQSPELNPASRRVVTRFLEDKTPVEVERVARTSSFRANVTIMEGCNKHCAFCIVPHTRGKERNRPARRILDEVARAADRGYVELQLLGQTVNSYKDPEQRGYKFAELLADVAQIQGIQRIRFTSPHPRHFDDDVIAVIAENRNICNQVHLPLQSGADPILKRMRRQHDREWYLELLDKFRGASRSIALSTDMIVGFPGETEADFEDTLSLVRIARFEQMFSFKYSVRPFTEASEWEDDVSEADKTRRLMILQRLQREIQLEIHNERYLGREFEILVEGTARDGINRFGRTTTNKVVNFPGKEQPGSFIDIRIDRIGPNSLSGQRVVDVDLADAV